MNENELSLQENNTPKYLFLNGFILKIIALFTMTLDHVAKLIEFGITSVNGAAPVQGSPIYTLLLVFQIIGRIALPIYLFLSVKGMQYTKSRPKYLLRIGIMTGIVGVALIVMQYAIGMQMGFNNIFITIFLGSLVLYLFEHKKIWVKPLALLPIAYVIILNIFRILGKLGSYPEALIPQYEAYGLLMYLMFYGMYKLAVFIANRKDRAIGNPDGTTIMMSNYQFIINIMMVGGLITLNLLVLLLCYGTGIPIVFWMLPNDMEGIQMYSCLAGIFLLFYNEKVGYNKRWFKYFNYAYYPAHILIGAIIVYVISLVLI